jgi:hypothetical protein
VFEVDGDELVPELGGDGVGGVAGVVGGIVDEDVDCGELGEDSVDAELERGGVGEIAAVVCGGVLGLWLEASDEGVGGFVLDVEEDDLGALMGEGFYEGCADAGGSSGDEDCAVAEAGVGGVGLGDGHEAPKLNVTLYWIGGGEGDLKVRFIWLADTVWMEASDILVSVISNEAVITSDAWVSQEVRPWIGLTGRKALRQLGQT